MVALLFCVNAFSQSTVLPQVVPDEVFDTPQPQMTQELFITKKRHSLKLLSQYAQTNFSQSGTGTTYSTGKTTALGFLAQHDYLLKNKNLIRTDLFFQPLGFKNPTTNRTQTITRTYLASHYGWKKKVSMLRTELLAGAALSHRSAFSDSQNLASSSQSLAPSVGLKAEYELNPQINLNASAFLSSPVWLKEEKRTGFYESGFYTLVRAGLSLKLSKTLRVQAEAMYEYEVLSFSGEGERSIRDARLSYRALSFPIGVEYVF